MRGWPRMADRDFRQLQRDFAAHLRDPLQTPAPDGIEDRRLAIYRDLFFNNIRGLLANNFPVLHEILGDERWTLLTRNFYREHVSRSPHFPEVPQEFLAWLENEFENDGSWPAFMQELAHYEWIELAVAIDPAELDQENFSAGGNLLEEVPVISPATCVLAYNWPVHRLGPDYQPETPGEPTFLVVYRRGNDEVGFLEVNALTARLLEKLQSPGAGTGRELLQAVATEITHPDPAALLRAGAGLLQELEANGIILGTRR